MTISIQMAHPLSERRRIVWMTAAIYFFLPSRFGQTNFRKKTFPARVILPGRGEADDSQSIASGMRHRSDRGDDI
jgi:hypothetical protein